MVRRRAAVKGVRDKEKEREGDKRGEMEIGEKESSSLRAEGITNL